MAEAVLSFAVGRLGVFLFQEGMFLYGVRDQLEWVETELRRIQCFLKDADAKRRKGDERVKNWVREVTEVAYQVEDAIDTFMLQVERRRRQRGLVGSIKRYTLILSELIARYKVGKEIEKIKIKVREISESRLAYGIDNLGEIGGDADESLESRRRVSPNLSDGKDVIVGFDMYCKEVMDQLLDTDIKRRCVISIVGMGGLGKTTLAKKVFNTREVVESFSTRIWVTVSQEYESRELLYSISRAAMGVSRAQLEEMLEEQVKEKLHGFLKNSVYLIVMDDIWSVNVWRQLNEVLPEAMNGSRVLFTTRIEEVARSADLGSPLFKLQLLDDNGSWELFMKTAFQTSSCPLELMEVARKMMERCRGLPLALVVLGGLLSTKPSTPLVWQKLLESMDWELTEDGSECLKILALSYNHLPTHYLKSCFLYMGVFPEDSEISASRLVNLWIAEGFIPQRGHELMEDIACSYLEELVQRSLIQAVRRSMHHGAISQCRIHDLLREMCLVEAKQTGFLNVVCSENTYMDNNNMTRHIPISRRSALDNLTNQYSPCLPRNLRSLIVSSNVRGLTFDGLKTLKLLRVLELPGGGLKLPEEIRLLTHLRYLRIDALLTGSAIIQKLRCLQILDLRGTISNPSEVTYFGELLDLRELIDLRHLYLPSSYKVRPPVITTLTKLQTLKNVDADEQWIKGNLARLTNLRNLSLQSYKGDGNALSRALGNLIHLGALKLKQADMVSVDFIVSLTEDRHFQKLFLKAKILERKLPSSGMFPPNLAKLTLVGSQLEQDPMPVLEKLPNLIFLELAEKAYTGKGMACTTGGFPQLRTLQLRFLGIVDWIVEAGALANLTKLEIRLCRRLTMLPDGLCHVTSLKEIVVRDGRRDFLERLRRGLGQDWPKIRHVPSIRIFKSAVHKIGVPYVEEVEGDSDYSD